MSDMHRLDRRHLLTLGVGAFVVAGVPFLARGQRRIVRRKVPVMGTIADLAVVDKEERAAHVAIDAAVAALRHVEGRMSFFLADSDVGRVNSRRDGVSVHRDTATVLERALRWAAATDGAFDPCLGGPSRLWDVKHRNTPPSGRAAGTFSHGRLWRDLDLEGRRVRLHGTRAQVDLGGIAKGHAVDLAVRALREHGVRDGLVNVGGDLYALGHSEDGDAWRVGIRDPQDADRILGSLEIRDEAVATSGDYEQGFEHGGRRYHHLLDASTGEPCRARCHSVTVRAPSCLDADAAATAAFLLEGAAEGPVQAAAPRAVIVRTA